jgi:hypothetical protein
MSKSAIASRPKRPPTPAQRLRQLDPELAALFDSWETTLDRDYNLAFNNDDESVPPNAAILDVETGLAHELGRLDLTLDPLLEVAGKLHDARDEAFMVLGRVEQLIAQRTLDAIRLTPHAALPAPGPGIWPDDPRRTDENDWGTPEEPPAEPPDDTLRDIHKAAALQPYRQEDFDDTPTTPLAVRVPTWWGRLRGRIGRVWAGLTAGALSAAGTATLLLRGVA